MKVSPAMEMQAMRAQRLVSVRIIVHWTSHQYILKTCYPFYCYIGTMMIIFFDFSVFSGSPGASNISIGSLHLNTGIGRSNVVTSGGNSSVQQTSLSQLIQFRTQRSTNRQRRCAYLNLNGRNSNPPAILQRLLGPSVAQNVNIGLGQVIANANGSASFRDATRVVVMDNGFGIFSNSGEPSIDLVDQAGYLFGRSLAATLNSTPSPLHWWLEEAKILGLESQADVCLTVCNDLIPELEVQRSMEMSKTRGKRKKKSSSDSNNAAATAQSNNKEKNQETNENAQEPLAAAVIRTNATITTSEGANNQETDGNQSNRQVIDDQPNNFAATSDERNDNGDNFDSEEETDDSADDDDNSSKNEDDVEQNDDNDAEECIPMPHLIRSYVESNEEMTESDGNPHEEDPNQNEENGGGSASDSGHSIASSVSTEAIYQIGQQQNSHDRHNLFGTNVNFVQAENDDSKYILYYYKSGTPVS